MAIKTNTSTSVAKTSSILASKIEYTAQNMKKLLTEAGCEECKTVKVFLPNIPGSNDDVVFVGLNGVGFYFKRGEAVAMPEPLLEILQNSKAI